jgi:hypothetical protein
MRPDPINMRKTRGPLFLVISAVVMWLACVAVLFRNVGAQPPSNPDPIRAELAGIRKVVERIDYRVEAIAIRVKVPDPGRSIAPTESPFLPAPMPRPSP